MALCDKCQSDITNILGYEVPGGWPPQKVGVKKRDWLKQSMFGVPESLRHHDWHENPSFSLEAHARKFARCTFPEEA